MIIGLGLDGRLGLSLGELARLGVEALGLGYQSLWTPQAGALDAFQLCGQWLGEARHEGLAVPRVGVGVVPARYVHPVSLASQAATLSLMSAGQAVTGVGTGPTGGLGTVAGGEHPVGLMREFLGAVRDLLAGRSGEYRGGTYPPLRLEGEGATPIPLYLGALGPAMLALCGELADGVVLNWQSPEQIAWSKERLQQAARAARRDPSTITVSSYVRVSISDDIHLARRLLGAQVLSYALNRPGEDPRRGYRAHFSRMGFDAVLAELEDRRARGASLDELIEAAPNELFSTVGYYGDAKGARAHLSMLSQGLDEPIVRVLAPPNDLDAVRATIIACAPGLG